MEDIDIIEDEIEEYAYPWRHCYTPVMILYAQEYIKRLAEKEKDALPELR